MPATQGFVSFKWKQFTIYLRFIRGVFHIYQFGPGCRRVFNRMPGLCASGNGTKGCKAGFIKVRGKCVKPPVRCNPGFRNVRGKCVKIPPPRPVRCNPGFRNVRGRCVKLPPPRPVQCRPGFRNVGGRCVQIPRPIPVPIPRPRPRPPVHRVDISSFIGKGFMFQSTTHPDRFMHARKTEIWLDHPRQMTPEFMKAASFKIVRGLSGPANSVSFQSGNLYLSVVGGKINLASGSSPAFKKSATFMWRYGLSGRAYSLESVSMPGYYITQSNYRVIVAKPVNSAMRNDATWQPVEGRLNIRKVTYTGGGMVGGGMVGGRVTYQQQVTTQVRHDVNESDNEEDEEETNESEDEDDDDIESESEAVEDVLSEEE